LDDEHTRRKVAWIKSAPCFTRGYGALHQVHVMQANQGCDFDFLQRDGANATPEADAAGEPETH
jgi:dihydroxy-acid dehydratase